ncbi:hypothetical protein vBYenSP400_84 [Yersinia phage vB_YenS_P400]|nr:hypothetical protein vBYenSP400_84 [Yersinia phage vB_YenS_P400]
MNKSRELFESHVTNGGKVPAPARKGDGYLSNHFNAMWIGWEASRAVKIELCEADYTCCHCTNNYTDDEVKLACTQAVSN